MNETSKTKPAERPAPSAGAELEKSADKLRSGLLITKEGRTVTKIPALVNRLKSSTGTLERMARLRREGKLPIAKKK